MIRKKIKTYKPTGKLGNYKEAIQIIFVDYADIWMSGKAKKYYKDGEHDKARDYCDMGIAYIREKRSQGMQANELLENVRLDLWLERFWMFLENKKLLLT